MAYYCVDIYSDSNPFNNVFCGKMVLVICIKAMKIKLDPWMAKVVVDLTLI